MENSVIIKDFNSIIDREIIVEVNGTEITCFIGYCPKKIMRGEKYTAELGLFVLDVFDMMKQEDSSCERSVIELDNGKYLLKGLLTGEGYLDVGFLIEDELLENYEYMYNSFVEIKIDRITIDFG